ncbi:MAG: GntR family transcriptional regulator [Bdellovibrionaceae bacterium]|nr:GntR family transcriptional regulator [Pseudobdellovibrionaceae bacterium]
MDITINTLEPTPVYEQIVHQVEQAVIRGDLASESPLPSIRQMANDMELNPNTVAKAYQILERNRVIFTAGRKGTFIHKEAAKNASQGLEVSIRESLSQLLELAKDRGLKTEKVQNIFNDQLNIIFKGEL